MSAELITLVFVGLGAGMLAGLLGIGGGIVIVPALVWISGEGIAFLPQAIATSLAIIVLAGSASTMGHQRHAAVVWPLVAKMSPGLIAGGALGGVIGAQLDFGLLRWFFVLGAALFGLKLVSGMDARGTLAEPTEQESHPRLPELAGLITGSTSALVGIGGGALTVPYLAHYGVDMRHAVGTSAACGVLLAVAGALSWSIARGFDFIDPTHVISIAPWAALVAPAGAQLAQRLPRKRLRQLFGLFLLMVSIRLALS